VRRHHLHPYLGGLAVPGHRHRPGHPESRRLGHRRPSAHRPRRRSPAPRRHHPPTPGPDDLSLRPRLSVHIDPVSHCCKRTRHTPVRWPTRPVLGQRRQRVVLRHDQEGTHPPPALGDPRRRPRGDLHLHRELVQHPPPALQPRQPQPQPVRSTPSPDRCHSGLRTTSTLSVEAGQLQTMRWTPSMSARSVAGLGVHPGDSSAPAGRSCGPWARVAWQSFACVLSR
jgi:hypothetical protein